MTHCRGVQVVFADLVNACVLWRIELDLVRGCNHVNLVTATHVEVCTRLLRPCMRWFVLAPARCFERRRSVACRIDARCADARCMICKCVAHRARTSSSSRRTRRSKWCACTGRPRRRIRRTRTRSRCAPFPTTAPCPRTCRSRRGAEPSRAEPSGEGGRRAQPLSWGFCFDSRCPEAQRNVRYCLRMRHNVRIDRPIVATGAQVRFIYHAAAPLGSHRVRAESRVPVVVPTDQYSGTKHWPGPRV